MQATRELRRRSRRVLTMVLGCVLGAAFAGNAQAAGPTFMPAPGSPVAVGLEPHSIASADFNRDGRADLATANISSDSVSILLGNGAGGFVASSVPVGDQPHSLAAGDFNRDSKVDLAVANAGADTISVLLGNGAGGFHDVAGSPFAAGDGPWYIVTADLNHDRKLDLIVSNVYGTGQFGLGTSVSVFLGNGHGGFAEAPGSPLTAGLVPYGIAVADLNRDGSPDLAIAGQFGSTVSIFLGNGLGGFAQATGSPIALPGRANSWIAAGDVDRDGKLDLAVANQAARNATSAQDITILLGDGSGGFTEASTSPIDSGGQGKTALVLADLDGDGRVDLATTNIFAAEAPYSVSILRGDGHADFASAPGSPIPVGAQSFALALGDLNRDDKPDLAVANTGSNSVTILLNTTPFARDLVASLRSDVARAPIGFALKRRLLADLLVAHVALRVPSAKPAACAALRRFVADVQSNAGTQGLTTATAVNWVGRAAEIKDAAGCET